MASRQIAEPQPPDPNANQPFHLVTDFVKHPANLAIDSLPQSHPQPRRLNQMDLLDSCALCVERQTVK
jgi:hypothetical protein